MENSKCMNSFLGFSFVRDSSYSTLSIVLASVQGSCFPSHFFLFVGCSVFWVLMPFLCCSDVKKCAFFWTEMTAVTSCTQKDTKDLGFQ